MVKADVAFLVYQPLKQRRKDNSFDGNDNIGAKVIEAVLNNAGVNVGFCSASNAHKYQLVLVSLTSTHDVYAFYKAVALLPSWQPGKRTFKVLAGGFGMQNPTTIRNYIDYAAFGRAHDWVFPVVDAILGGGEPDKHPSLMFLPDMHDVTFHQAPLMTTPTRVDAWFGDTFQEQFTGCPLKCKFCHYTWARKYDDQRETRGSYVQELFTNGSSPELTWDQLFTYPKKVGKARVAIDGFSERLRWLYGKKISNKDIVEGLEAIGRFDGNTIITTYNIANMPTETGGDVSELYETLKRVTPPNRVIFVLHSTPFRPSLATPMQWEQVTLFPDWSKEKGREIVDSNNFRAVHSLTLETPYSHLMSVVAERATRETDKLFHAMVFNGYLNRARSIYRLRALEKEFDTFPYIREYDIDERHPAWFLSSYTDNEVIKRAARKMRRDASDENYQLKGRSLVAVRLAREKQVVPILMD